MVFPIPLGDAVVVKSPRQSALIEKSLRQWKEKFEITAVRCDVPDMG